MEDPIIEEIAEAVHLGWMQEKQRQGFADHAYKPGGKADDGSRRCLRCYGPEDRHHPDMLPYADLAENAKEYDRVTARAVLTHLNSLGYTIILTATLETSLKELENLGEMLRAIK